MRDARCVTMVTAVLASVLLASCAVDLGKCDQSMLGGSSTAGTAKPNNGQLIVEKTCAGGRCHASTAKGADRVGVPAGLNFDVVPTSNSAEELARVNNSAKVVHDKADAMWAEVDGDTMPPKNQNRTLSAMDKETLRNWLACGAPVIVASGSVTADWPSIYTGLTSSGCLGCHGGDGMAGGNFGLGTDACTAYKAVVSQPATTIVGMPPCASSGLSRVLPGQPDMSLIVKKVEATQPCGTPMPPPTGLGASNSTAMALRAWITAGALPPPGCM